MTRDRLLLSVTHKHSRSSAGAGTMIIFALLWGSSYSKACRDGALVSLFP